MRILYVSDSYYPHINGVYYFVCRIAPLLEKRGHQVAVLAPSENMYYTQKKIDGINVYGVPSLPILYFPNIRVPIRVLLKARIRQLLDHFRPDVIHIQDHFLLASTVVTVNRERGIPIIGTNHFMTENFTALFRSAILKRKIDRMMWAHFSRVFNQLLLVTTPTETAARLINTKLNVEVLAISSGIDLDTFNPLGDFKDIKEKYAIPDKPVLLYVGRLDPEKNLEEVLQAVALALNKISFHFVIAGKGIKRVALENLCKQLGIEEHVNFAGFVPDEDLPYFYKFSQCFIIASTAELLSLGTLQAMASGLPVIAVTAGALTELVYHKANGYLFKSGDIERMAAHIHEMFSRNDLYPGMCQESLALVQRHNINNTVLAFEELYFQLPYLKTENRVAIIRQSLATHTG